MDGLQIVGPTPTPNVSAQHLVDEIAVQDAIASEATARSRELKTALLALVGDKKQQIDGFLHRATIVEAAVQWRLDEKLIKEAMGERWCIQHSKQCIRKAYVLITGRKLRESTNGR